MTSSDPDQKELTPGLSRIVEDIKLLPPHLYRYHSLRGVRRGWAERIIGHREVYFASASLFNDPYDCRPDLDLEGTDDEISRFLESHLPTPPEPGSGQTALIELFRRSALDGELGGATRVQVQANIQNTPILSLSSQPDLLLMWSYYADGHRGICIRFRTNMEAWMAAQSNAFPIKVRYNDFVPAVNPLKMSADEFLALALGQKSTSFEHESEWRMISPSHPGRVSLLPGIIDGVILGSAISPEDIDEVRRWASEVSPIVAVGRAKQQANKFGVVIDWDS